MQRDKLTADQFNYLINHESGLLGVSETSSDMGDLLLNDATDVRADEELMIAKSACGILELTNQKEQEYDQQDENA